MTVVLGIESSCDETAASVVVDGKTILSNIVASQVDLHQVYGGVVPELACRRHADVIISVIDQAIKEAGMTMEKIDLLAVAKGPGLIGALLIGINTAKAISLALQKPLVAVNHVEAHLYATMMSETVTLPCIGAVLSGGHTALVRMDTFGEWKLLGETVDDAIGEAFDKAAKILGLPYPGGPSIEQFAKGGDENAYPLKAGSVKANPLAFSFSGLKTGVLYTAKGQSASISSPLILNQQEQKNLAASFQKAAFADICKKLALATQKEGISTVLFGGGVTCNQYLREKVAQDLPEIRALWPQNQLSLDNAAMIAGLGYHIYKTNGASSLDFPAETRIAFIPIDRNQS